MWDWLKRIIYGERVLILSFAQHGGGTVAEYLRPGQSLKKSMNITVADATDPTTSRAYMAMNIHMHWDGEELRFL